MKSLLSNIDNLINETYIDVNFAQKPTDLNKQLRGIYSNAMKHRTDLVRQQQVRDRLLKTNTQYQKAMANQDKREQRNIVLRKEYI